MLAELGSGEVLVFTISMFFFVIFFWLMISVFSDIFRDHSISGWVKAAWVLFIVIAPLLGILIYLIARGGSMAKRSLAAQAEAKKSFDDYVRSVAASDSSGGGSADQLTQLADLHKSGTLSDEEYEKAKARVTA